MPERPEGAFLTLAPDWACEVLSPSTDMVDRLKRVPIHARDRVAHVWLVRPASKMLEIYRLDGDRYRLLGTHAEDALVRAEPFDALELELGVLWAR